MAERPRRVQDPHTRPHSGTRCSRFAFIRAGEIVHTASAASISSHVASGTSPDRAAVSTRNSNASLTAGCAEPDARTVSIAAAASLYGSASRCVAMSFCAEHRQHAIATVVVSQVHGDGPGPAPRRFTPALVSMESALSSPAGRLPLDSKGEFECLTGRCRFHTKVLPDVMSHFITRALCANRCALRVTAGATARASGTSSARLPSTPSAPGRRVPLTTPIVTARVNTSVMSMTVRQLDCRAGSCRNCSAPSSARRLRRHRGTRAVRLVALVVGTPLRVRVAGPGFARHRIPHHAVHWFRITADATARASGTSSARLPSVPSAPAATQSPWRLPSARFSSFDSLSLVPLVSSFLTACAGFCSHTPRIPDAGGAIRTLGMHFRVQAPLLAAKLLLDRAYVGPIHAVHPAPGHATLRLS